MLSYLKICKNFSGEEKEKYRKAMKEIRERCFEFFDDHKASSSRFGATFEDHCTAVETLLVISIGETRFGDDNDYIDNCLFILGLVAWAHPIQTFHSDERDFSIDLYEELYAILDRYSIDSNIMTIAKEVINAPPDLIDATKDNPHVINNKKYSTTLLFCYFYLAYKFHLDRAHFDDGFKPSDLIEVFIKPDTEVSRDLKIQWLKTIFIKEPFFDRDEKFVELTLRIPVEWADDREFQSYLRKDILEPLIREDLEEAVHAVMGFFVKNSNNKRGHEVAASHLNNIFLSVKIKDEYEAWTANESGKYLLGNIEVDQSYLKEMLYNAALMIYPNATKLVNIATRNIRRLATLDGASAEEVVDRRKREMDGEDGRKREEECEERRERIKNFLSFMKSLIDTRPCHASLIIVRDILKRQIDRNRASHGSQTCEEFLREVDNVVGQLQKDREARLENLTRASIPLFTDGGNILLYGNSDTITRILSRAIAERQEEAQEVEIFICECRNKSLYNHDNSFRYCDGLEYARKILGAEFKKVFVVSEASLGNLFSERGRINKVFFGANGVSIADGHCVHSLGHLLVAQLARTYRVPVYVFADAYKFYRIEPRPFRIKRENCWIGNKKLLMERLHLDSEFKKLKENELEEIFGEYNRREDVIPMDLITAFVTDKGIISAMQVDSFLSKLEREIDAIVGG